LFNSIPLVHAVSMLFQLPAAPIKRTIRRIRHAAVPAARSPLETSGFP
jgi:hypothetical protein